MEQGAFNKLTEKYNNVVFQMDDKFNATVNVNMVADPVIYAWHGVNPWEARYDAMRDVLKEDYINFRV
jgi:D-hexose-6-phosphate mutarotase